MCPVVSTLVNNEEFATTQGEHWGPVKLTCTEAGSKPLPSMMKINLWPCTGELGLVPTALIAGAPPDVLEMVSCCGLDGVPLDPLLTVTE
jgi:hypothetical protein